MFFITTVSEDGKSTRCVGYFKDLKEAKERVKKNYCDIFEFLYKYAVIEKVPEGIYRGIDSEYWFEIDLEKLEYKEIEKPEQFEGYICFGIG